MTSLWMPAPTSAQVLVEPHLPDSPFHQSLGFTRPQLRATRDIPAAERRLALPNFIDTFCWEAIRPRLPLRLVVAPTQPATGPDQPAPLRLAAALLPLPLRLVAPGGDVGPSPAAWQGLDDFDLILRLFDCSAWRPSWANASPASMARRPSIRLAWAWPGSWRVARLELAATGHGVALR